MSKPPTSSKGWRSSMRASRSWRRSNWSSALVERDLDAGGIPSALLKGAAVACMGYRRMGMRRFKDNDLLIDHTNLAAAVAALRQLGYVQGDVHFYEAVCHGEVLKRKDPLLAELSDVMVLLNEQVLATLPDRADDLGLAQAVHYILHAVNTLYPGQVPQSLIGRFFDAHRVLELLETEDTYG
ncbi:nucleotidyltransferase family protein [Nonomuraea sp. NPDC050227]|uniref:nucleotidyltransferase family protein n=1 Tax=Nonomuraea sp. NPDC050227 TaxID=3364360 RepID=UPI0037B79CA7